MFFNLSQEYKKISVSISKFTIFLIALLFLVSLTFYLLKKGKLINLLIFHFFLHLWILLLVNFSRFFLKVFFCIPCFCIFFFNKIDDWGIFHLILRKFLWFSLFEGVFWWSTELFALFCFMVGCSLKTEKWN